MPSYKIVESLESLSYRELVCSSIRVLVSLVNKEGAFPIPHSNSINERLFSRWEQQRKLTRQHRGSSREVYHHETQEEQPAHGAIQSEQQKEQVQKMREHFLYNLPPKFRETILNSCLKYLSWTMLDPSTPCSVMAKIKLQLIRALGRAMSCAIQCFAGKDITYLDMSPAAHRAEQWILSYRECETHRGGMKMLDLSQAFEEMFLDLFSENSSFLTHLQFLKLPHFVSAPLMWLIACNGYNLEHLILNCDIDCNLHPGPVESEEVCQVLPALCGEEVSGFEGTPEGCRKLQTCILPIGVHAEENIEYYGVMMLKFMKNLKVFKGAPMTHVMTQFIESSDYSAQQLQLIHFHHGAYKGTEWQYYVFSDECIPVSARQMVRLLPDVTQLSLYAHPVVTEDVLRNFPNVKELSLFTDEFDVLSNYLCNLRTLDINIAYQEEWPFLVSLSSLSPTLEQLTLRSFTLHLGDPPSMERPEFPSLVTLRLMGQNLIQEEALYRLLQGCRALTSLTISAKLSLDEKPKFDDEMLARIVPVLKNLTFLKLKGNWDRSRSDERLHITIASFDHLVSSCPNLSSIGHLSHWNITEEQLDEVYRKVQRNNWDIRLT